MKPIPYVSAPATRYIKENVKQINNGINTVNQTYETLENKLQVEQPTLLHMRNALSTIRDNAEGMVQKYNALYEDYQVRAHISNLRDEEIVELKQKQIENTGGKTRLLALAFAGLFGLGCLAGCYVKRELDRSDNVSYTVKEVKK